MKSTNENKVSRRSFMYSIGSASLALGLTGVGCNNINSSDQEKEIIPGFETSESENGKIWEPFSDKKVKVGIAGFGTCEFGAHFGFQNHPNVEVVAVTDLDPERCRKLAEACNCKKTYPSCEEMIKDKNIDAVFIATDAPSHARLSIEALNNEKHVACAVPAVWGANGKKEADMLYEAVKKSGKKYMMYETSAFRDTCYRWMKKYQADEFGKIIYSEGEYYHVGVEKLTAYNPKTGKVDLNGWRKGLPPLWYPTHSTAFYVCVTGKRLTDVSCLGMPSIVKEIQAKNNPYKNPFGTEIALMRTSEGGMSRMAVSWDMHNAHGEKGRLYGQKEIDDSNPIDVRPALPPDMPAGGHGGSHGHLTCNFIESILLDKTPLVDISTSLNLTLSGIVAHQSALKNGEWMKISQYI